MAIIKSYLTDALWTIDPTSKAGRATFYNTDGEVFPAVEAFGLFSRYYMAGPFRAVGAASTPNNLCTLEVPEGSSAIISIENIFVTNTSTALLASVNPLFSLARVTGALPTQGTVVPIRSVEGDTSFHPATVIVRSVATADGTNGTAITATAGSIISRAFASRLHTLAGETTTPPTELLPNGKLRPIIVRSNQAIVLQTVTATATSDHFLISIVWRGVKE